MKVIDQLKRIGPLLPGFHGREKVLAIESDDWGSIRTPNRKTYENLLRKGYPVDRNPFLRFDAFESDPDLEGLLDVLRSVKNSNGQHPRMTVNCIGANPDFESIKAGGYESYHYELAECTATRYPDSGLLYGLYEQGVEDYLIRPQLHGREHLNVSRWLRDIRAGHKHLIDAFEQRMFSLTWDLHGSYPNEYMDAFDLDDIEELPYKCAIIEDAARIFRQRWGYSSRSFISCCYIWHRGMHWALKDAEVEYVQGLAIQHEPLSQKSLSYRPRYHYTGQRCRSGLVYLVRNAFFEPTVHPNIDNVDSCLARIALAFRFGKPAIISTHRLNYVGRIVPRNRDENLFLLRELLRRIVRAWPDVKFVFSDELGDRIRRAH